MRARVAAPVLAKGPELHRGTRRRRRLSITDWVVDYEPVGSLAGIMRLKQNDMDFAARKWPMPPSEVTKQGTLIPIVSAASHCHQYRGHPGGALAANRSIAGRYLRGKIRTGPIQKSRRAESRRALPENRSRCASVGWVRIDIVFTQYLSLVSTAWRNKHGADTLINWPTGSVVRASQGVIRRSLRRMAQCIRRVRSSCAGGLA